MPTRLFVGDLVHARTGAVAHTFRYPVYTYAFDLDELPELARRHPWFGHNRVRPVALHDRDHLDAGPGTLREKLTRALAAAGVADDFARVTLVTGARFFHYAFNPVSFFYCYGSDGAVRCVVAEVNNTFGERHPYVLADLERRGGFYEPRRTVGKVFYVSPFYDMTGEYRFRFSDLRERLDIQVRLEREGQTAFAARLAGEPRPFDGASFARTLAGQPLSAVLTVPRIAWQAAKLHYGKKVAVHAKPLPAHPLTRRTAAPSWPERVALRLGLRALRGWREGALELRLPDGRELVFGEPGAAGRARLEVVSYRLFVRLVRDGAIGLGEGYTAGEFRTPDLVALLQTMGENRRALEAGAGRLAGVSAGVDRLRHAARGNTRAGARRNIGAHYDLGNDFFASFLDPSMTYSAARYLAPGDTLERAQENKLDAALAKSGAGAGSHVLEIGFGWGSFALRAARRAGCRVTGLTLSREQLEYARGLAEREGLAGRVDFELRDYRDATGVYDAVVSIEMLEAVGHAQYGTFFAACDRRLRAGGRAVIQVITIADERYDEYRRRPDWIQKHIFPGGHLPSLAALDGARRRHSSLALRQIETFGADYARTLGEWRARFRAAEADLERLGYEREFRRRWEYYLSYCEAGFRLGEIDVCQMVLEKPAAG